MRARAGAAGRARAPFHPARPGFDSRLWHWSTGFLHWEDDLGALIGTEDRRADASGWRRSIFRPGHTSDPCCDCVKTTDMTLMLSSVMSETYPGLDIMSALIEAYLNSATDAPCRYAWLAHICRPV